MYAQLCRKLSEEVPNFETHASSSASYSSGNSSQSNTFCKLLLAKCKDEFENRRKASEAFGDGPLSVDDEEQRTLAKQKMLGNIKFICELGKQQLVQESILHVCIQQLCKKKVDESLQNKAEDLECLCQIMKTIGCLLDTEKAKPLMDQYFERMARFARSAELPSRIRFMLQDVLELRDNKWVPRRVQREQNPKTIVQIREEAAKDYGVVMPYPNSLLTGYKSGLNNYAVLNQTINAAGMRSQQFNQPASNPILAGTLPGQRLLDDYYSTPLPSFGPGKINATGGVPMDPLRNHYANQASRRVNPLGTQPPLQHPSPVPSPPHMGLNNHRGQAGEASYSSYRGSHGSQEYRRERDRNDVGRHANNTPLAQQQQAALQQSQVAGSFDIPPRFLRKAMLQQVQPAPPPSTHQRAVSNTVPPPIQPSGQALHSSKNVLTLQNHFSTLDASDISLRPQNAVFKPNMGLGKPLMMGSAVSGVNVMNSKNVDTQHSMYIKSTANKPNKNNVENVTISRNSNQSNKEYIMKKAEDALQEFVSENGDVAEIVLKLKDLKIPKNFQYDVLVTIIKKSLDKSEGEREAASKFLTRLKNENVIGYNIFITAFTNLLNQLPELESHVPLVKSHVAAFIARAISDEIIALKEAYDLVEGGQHYPLFLLCLKQLHQILGQEWLVEKFNDSKINLIMTLPEIDRKKERLADILRDRGLSFLYPLLRIESDLWQQINMADCTPSSLYRWIKENVDSSLHHSPGFINVLFTSVAKYVTEKAKQAASEATFNEGQSPNNTATSVNDYEKDLLSKYRIVLNAFLNEKTNLQLVALYALQSYWFDLGYPKGMLLRWFIFLYDMEIVEEEVFIKWREDINDEYPGKGNALFQVNNWLNWLAEAEEAEDEEEEGSDSGTK